MFIDEVKELARRLTVTHKEEAIKKYKENMNKLCTFKPKVEIVLFIDTVIQNEIIIITLCR
jgi:hypothetical protein